MNLRAISDVFSSWMTSVAQTIVAAGGGIRPRQAVRLIEEEAGSFRVEAAPKQAPLASAERICIRDGEIAGSLPANLIAVLKGSRVDLVLQPGRFVFRQVELPKRATEFLDGIVRSQIDRLTPWTAHDAAFGWTPPDDIDKERISLTVVATARTLVAPYVQALAAAGAEAVSVLAAAPGNDPAAAAINIFEHRAHGRLDENRVRGILIALFVATGLSAAIASMAAQVIGSDLDQRQSDVSFRVSQRRIAIRTDGPNTPAQLLLERRKHETAATLLVLEELSKILPDHTYLTELRIENGKLQIAGLTGDAPSLIPLIERSPHFKHASFSAPTTRSPGESGERFHIEAHLNPVFSRS